VVIRSADLLPELDADAAAAVGLACGALRAESRLEPEAGGGSRIVLSLGGGSANGAAPPNDRGQEG
jgi:hypothetical protein